MFEIVFLGTSASAPSIHRGLSSQVVKYNEYRFMIDCGEGTQRQILKSGIGFKRLNHILITHGHLDHILGLAGLFSTFSRWETIEEVTIHGGKYALERISNLLYGVQIIHPRKSQIEINFEEISPGVIFEEDSFSLSAFSVSHRGPDCFGYKFEEKPRRPFLSEKADALGVPFGPERSKLVGGKAITLADGRTIHPEEVLGPEKPGTRLVHVGDTGRTDDILEHCQGADTLVIEATYLKAEEDMARQFAHLTAEQAARLAKEAGVGQLILTHLSRRYRERDVYQEAQKVFPNTAVARDFDIYQVRRGETVKVERK
ncbi:ribonuclease Z [bacterium]|nr:ribonuclease Z [bacterium]MCB2178964.1 ribonuclease Z [bacterium]